MKRLLCSCLCLLPLLAAAQSYTRQDTLRGSNGRGRNWWDVQHYRLQIAFDTARKSITGTNRITFKVIAPAADSMQIDLQDGMFLDEVLLGNKPLAHVKDGNVFWVKHPFSQWQPGESYTMDLQYHGRPHIARNPPWDGGFIRTKDSLGNPWTAVACQGFGASSWWPCKDYQGDEPDSGMSLTLGYKLVPDAYDLTGDKAVAYGRNAFVGNGRSNGIPAIRSGATHWDAWTDTVGYLQQTFSVRNPINTYDVTFYLGDYAHWQDTLMGEKGRLDLDFYPLRCNEVRARQQFAVTKQLLHCFEYWMGPYPFYEDGYKLVEAPYLGMEHQSAVAYGNKYRMGYLGQDRSKTGIGLLFDFIIVHESGHEWFGNSITAQDIADNWLHEGFTTYTEGLFAECATSRDSAFRYIRGEWDNIRNDKPVIGDYGVNSEGSSDMYDKGAAVVHMVRNIMADDERFRQLLRGLNRDFYHRIVTSAELEAYISKAAGKDLKPLFDQYLRTTDIPVLEYYTVGRRLHYRFTGVVPGFSLPVAAFTAQQQIPLSITGEWQEVRLKRRAAELNFSPDFLYRLHYLLEP